MSKKAALILIPFLCFTLAACGAAAPASSVSAAAPESTVEAAPAPNAAVEPAEEIYDLKPLVDSLNEEETAQHTDEDLFIAVFEEGQEPNTIIYKIAMETFQYVIQMAEEGEQESLNAYNRLIESLPELENSLENALHETIPALNVKIYMMADENSDIVTAVVEGGEIAYDLVNGVGTAPVGVKPILTNKNAESVVKSVSIG